MLIFTILFLLLYSVYAIIIDPSLPDHCFRVRSNQLINQPPSVPADAPVLPLPLPVTNTSSNSAALNTSAESEPVQLSEPVDQQLEPEQNDNAMTSSRMNGEETDPTNMPSCSNDEPICSANEEVSQVTDQNDEEANHIVNEIVEQSVQTNSNKSPIPGTVVESTEAQLPVRTLIDRFNKMAEENNRDGEHALNYKEKENPAISEAKEKEEPIYENISEGPIYEILNETPKEDENTVYELIANPKIEQTGKMMAPQGNKTAKRKQISLCISTPILTEKWFPTSNLDLNPCNETLSSEYKTSEPIRATKKARKEQFECNPMVEEIYSGIKEIEIAEFMCECVCHIDVCKCVCHNLTPCTCPESEVEPELIQARSIDVSVESAKPCAHVATPCTHVITTGVQPVLSDDLPIETEEKESSENMKTAKQKKKGMNKWKKTLIGTSVVIMVLFILVV